MRLWVYLKSSGQLQYIITSQREGEREGKEESERRGVGNIMDCLRKIDCQKMAGGAVKLKMRPAGSERERGNVQERCQHRRSMLMVVGGLERPAWKAARPETSLPQARTSFP